MQFKRNQVEAAISRVVGSGSAKPGSELRTRLKRLLETDRGLGRERVGRSGARESRLYGVDAPGRGVEIWFSGYEAFALLTGFRLMQHGWPQGFAVAVLRDVRPELEGHHERIVKQDPATLFDQQRIIREAKPGDIVVSNTDPVFLAITSKGMQDRSGPVKAAICRGRAK